MPSKQRTVPGHPELRPVLRAWPDARSTWPGAQDSPAPLLNRRGGRLFDRAARAIIDHLGVAAGLSDDPRAPFSPHGLRHTFATQILRGGADIVTVAELLGHARLDTTRAYTLRRPPTGNVPSTSCSSTASRLIPFRRISVIPPPRPLSRRRR